MSKQSGLFDNCVFYFYPPRNVSRLNGVKANASAKHGAQVASVLGPNVTHILVARQCDTPDFWNIVNSAQLASNCVIIRSDWCNDSMDQQRLIDLNEYLILESAEESPPQLLNEPRAKRARRENAIVPQDAESLGIGRLSETGKPQPGHTHAPRIDQNTGGKNSSADKKQLVIDMLHELMHARRSSGEDYSAKAYEKALQAIEDSGLKVIAHGSDVKHLVSQRMAKLIDQICDGKLVPSFVPKPTQSRQHVLDLFCTVYGIGPHHAKKLYEKGYRTLRELYDVLDENAKVSIVHHEDLVERMSRTEVSQHYAKVVELAKTLDKDLELYCMGSYRRDKPDCGDIDIIVTKKGSHIMELNDDLNDLIDRMVRTGLATHTFTRGSDRWLGATQVTGRWRRMDILIVPSKEFGAAMLYYTGSGGFNHQMRWIAKQQGMRLNHNGLFKDGKLVESEDEKHIFELLGMTYREPKDR